MSHKVVIISLAKRRINIQKFDKANISRISSYILAFLFLIYFAASPKPFIFPGKVDEKVARLLRKSCQRKCSPLAPFPQKLFQPSQSIFRHCSTDNSSKYVKRQLSKQTEGEPEELPVSVCDRKKFSPGFNDACRQSQRPQRMVENSRK